MCLSRGCLVPRWGLLGRWQTPVAVTHRPTVTLLAGRTTRRAVVLPHGMGVHGGPRDLLLPSSQSRQNSQGGTGGPVWQCPVSCPSKDHCVSRLGWGVPDLRRYGGCGHQNRLRGSSPSESDRGAAQSWAPRSSAGSHLPPTPAAAARLLRQKRGCSGQPATLQNHSRVREPKSINVWPA